MVTKSWTKKLIIMNKHTLFTINIINHKKGVRPTVHGRRPFLGSRNDHPRLFVYNGLGSKGSSLVSYFSPKYAEHLTKGIEIIEDVDVNRLFTSVS